MIQRNKTHSENDKKTTSVFLILKNTLNKQCTLQEEKVSKKNNKLSKVDWGITISSTKMIYL